MKKVFLLVLLSLLSSAYALDGLSEMRAIKVYDRYVARYIREDQREKNQAILNTKIVSLSKQITETTQKKRKEYYAYLQHLFCEKRNLTNGILCEDDYYAGSSIGKPVEHYTLDTLRSMIADEHSLRRERQGLSSLREHTTLHTIAQLYALKLCEAGYITHELDGSTLETRFGEKKYRYEWAGENLALGQKTIGSLMDQLTTSIHHRENIYRPEFAEIGIGHCDDIWVINYGKRRSQ